MPAKVIIYFTVISAYLLSSCHKDKSYTSINSNFPPCKTAPLLTSKIWYADTILIEPAGAFNQLTAQEQYAYKSGGFWKLFRLQFNSNNCSVVQLNPDWDYVYNKWYFSNNDSDIVQYDNTGRIRNDTLFAYTVTLTQFTHKRKKSFYTEVYVYK